MSCKVHVCHNSAALGAAMILLIKAIYLPALSDVL